MESSYSYPENHVKLRKTERRMNRIITITVETKK